MSKWKRVWISLSVGSGTVIVLLAFVNLVKWLIEYLDGEALAYSMLGAVFVVVTVAVWIHLEGQK